MKSFLLLIIFSFAISIHCFSRNNSDSTKSHRWWVNPTQIVTGQYTLAYAWSINDGRNWYEAAIGYQYFRSFEPYYAPGGNLATPKFGIGFTGPVISFSSSEFYTKVKRGMRKAAEQDTTIQKMITNTRSRNSTRYELQYQYLRHQADCYYAGEENDSYTFSSIMHCISGEVLFARILGNKDHHILWESYIGIGFHFGFGNETKYIDTTFQNYGSHDLCVQNIHDPNVIASNVKASYLFPMLQFGVRMGFQ